MKSNLDSSHLILFVYRNLRIFIIVGIVATLVSSAVSLMMEEKFVTEDKAYSKRFRSIGKRLNDLEQPLPFQNIELETGPAIRLH